VVRRSRRSSTVDDLFEAASDAASAARDFLASEQGRRIRHGLATAIILSAPLISEVPVIRRSTAARVLRTAAVGALIVKAAEWMRDWEPVAPPTGTPPAG
jgi:hypothetical protein